MPQPLPRSPPEPVRPPPPLPRWLPLSRSAPKPGTNTQPGIERRPPSRSSGYGPAEPTSSLTGSVASGEAAKVTWRDLFDTTSPIEHANEFAAGLESLDAALAAMVGSGDTEAAKESFNALAERMGLTKQETVELAEQLPQYQDALAGAAAAGTDAAAGAEEMTSALDDQIAALEEAKQGIADYAEAQRAASDPVFAMIEALDKVDTAQTGYNEAVKEYGEESPEASAAALDLAEAVAGAEQAALDGDLSYGQFSQKLDDWVTSGILTARQAEIIKGRVNDARAAAEDYQGPYAASINAIDNASTVLGRVRTLIAQIQSKTITITARANIPSPLTARSLEYYTGRAAGGPVPAGGAHAAEGGPRGGSELMVGENGPEIVELPFGSNVIPAGETANRIANASGGGNLSVTVNAGVIGSQPELLDWLVKSLDQLNRRGRLTGISA